MNGNPAYHAIALAVATLLLLPFPVAIFAGWTPPKLPSRAAALPYAWAMLCFYALAPINAVPRMLDASADVVMACTAAGIVPTAAAFVLLVRAAGFPRQPASRLGD
ncbi:hypothetical protein [Streptomyces erythrochromogenes]|uniref:hypothetical protein n=1 Tax=Streptomyces erythrochromogenes TaxID=285574 RepID=UPI0002F7EE0E